MYISTRVVYTISYQYWVTYISVLNLYKKVVYTHQHDGNTEQEHLLNIDVLR